MSELLVMVQIAGRHCALRAHDVQSAIELGAVTPVPAAPAYVTGITALRSQALTVLDCRRAIGFREVQWPTDHRAVVAMIDGHSYALQVDLIDDVTTGNADAGQVQGGFGPCWSRVARGMIETGAGPALLLELPVLIAGPDATGAAA